MRALIPIALTSLVAMPALGAELRINVEIPRLNVAEYHRPYVAIWIERPDQSLAANLAVWYDIKLKNKEGEKWLKDMRQWWRRSGRELQMPVDGLSGATRAPGEHQLSFSADKSPLAKLPAGDYVLMVEAAREVGGRELVKIPFKWPAASGPADSAQSAKGEHELGTVTLQLKP